MGRESQDFFTVDSVILHFLKDLIVTARKTVGVYHILIGYNLFAIANSISAQVAYENQLLQYSFKKTTLH